MLNFHERTLFVFSIFIMIIKLTVLKTKFPLISSTL